MVLSEHVASRFWHLIWHYSPRADYNEKTRKPTRRSRCSTPYVCLSVGVEGISPMKGQHGPSSYSRLSSCVEGSPVAAEQKKTFDLSFLPHFSSLSLFSAFTFHSVADGVAAGRAGPRTKDLPNGTNRRLSLDLRKSQSEPLLKLYKQFGGI